MNDSTYIMNLANTCEVLPKPTKLKDDMKHAHHYRKELFDSPKKDINKILFEWATKSGLFQNMDDIEIATYKELKKKIYPS